MITVGACFEKIKKSIYFFIKQETRVALYSDIDLAALLCFASS